MRRAAALAVLAALAAAPAHAKTVRVFAVGPKFNLSWVDTRQHFHDHIVGLVDRKQRKGAGVQQQADDVASHLLKGEHNLVTFPEDLGLMAIFTGSQGRQARGASDVTTAIVDVLGAYAPQTAYYAAKYPELTQRPLPTRLLAIAATDTFARVAVETYAEIAAKYHVWLEGGIDMAQDWHVVCNSKATMPKLPGGVGCDEENPATVAQLRSPDEPNRTYAYEATTDKASNMALVFDPTGKLVSKQVKTYLTPIELQSQLDLLPGEVFTGLSALKTPVGTLGFVTSKDAWMPDVLDRLDHAGVDVLVQPEWFVNDTVATKGMWSPDTLKASGYSALLRQPSFGSWIEASMTGNVFDYSADAQSAIAVKPRSANGPRGRLLGQALAPGLVAVSPWVVPDPVSTPIVQRRLALGRAGEALLPNGSGPECPAADQAGPCRGGQVESVIWHDVEVGRAPRLRKLRLQRRGRAPFAANRPLARARAAQRDVALAANGRRVWAVFEQAGHLRLARSDDAGRRWKRARDLGSGDWPAISAGGPRELWLAYDRGDRVQVAHSTDGGRTFRRFAPAGDAPQRRPSIAARGAGRAYAAWIDERDRFAEDDLPRADVYGARLTASGPSTPQRLDTAPTTSDLAAKLDNDWAPSVAAAGPRVLVAWTDFRNYRWDVVGRLSSDGGATFGAVTQADDVPSDLETLDDTPRAELRAGRPVLAWTDYRKTRDPLPHPLDDIRAADRQIDGHGAAQIVSAAPSLAGGLVAWQDHARGIGEILVRRIGATAAPARVGDRGARGNAWRPAVARAGGRAVVAWEDERDGPSQIYVTSAPAARVP